MLDNFLLIKILLIIKFIFDTSFKRFKKKIYLKINFLKKKKFLLKKKLMI